MRKLISALSLGMLFTIPLGCGSSSPEEADTSHLESEKAEEKAAAERGKYENAGRKGPDAPKTK